MTNSTDAKVTKKKLRAADGYEFGTVILTEESPGSYPRKIKVTMGGTFDGNVDLGFLRYTERRFNIQRPVTVKSWTATTHTGERLGVRSTQKAALIELLEKLNLTAAATALK